MSKPATKLTWRTLMALKPTRSGKKKCPIKKPAPLRRIARKWRREDHLQALDFKVRHPRVPTE